MAETHLKELHVTDIRAIWDKANTFVNCLHKLKTERGRRRYVDTEEMLDVRNDFVSDEARILSSKSWRALARKTQVFTLPENSLIRTRGYHVGEVVADSIIVAAVLGLNIDLVRAASLGHDLGHGPLGHQGETWTAQKMGRPFCHERMAAIIVQKIERKGQGLNLSYETIEGMMCHSGDTAREGMTQEAWVIRYCDKMAYVFADINDIGTRAGYLLSKEIVSLANEFGKNQRERTTTAQSGLIIESAEIGRVSFQHSELAQKFQKLRNLMMEVYPRVTQQDVDGILGNVFKMFERLDLCDPFLLLALMTDDEAFMLAKAPMKDMSTFSRTGLAEIVPYLAEIGKVDLCDPDLDW